jgi:carboxyl-terminal processing protease
LKCSDRNQRSAMASKGSRSSFLFGIFLLLAACASEPGTIGAALGKRADGRMFVRSTPPGQGAAEAGLLIDDEIVAIEGRDVKTMSEEDVRRAVRGDLGSKLTITIVREGQRRDVTVKRSKLK